jgi:hypothetical protein
VLDLIGWVATAVSAASYFSRDPLRLRRIQAGAAFIWIAYGLTIGSRPLIAANAIVAAAAVHSIRRDRSR